jgi:hypothetical protein
MRKGHICQLCGVEAPTRYVAFYQNIGALVMHFHRNIKGYLCKRCINANFWKMTGTTIGIGWLGPHSIIIAPFLVINNIVRYVGTIGMPAVPPGAQRPVVDEAVANKINPILPQVFDLLNQKTELNDIATELAPAVGVSPAQLVSYVIAVIQAQARQANATAGQTTQPASQPTA